MYTLRFPSQSTIRRAAGGLAMLLVALLLVMTPASAQAPTPPGDGPPEGGAPGAGGDREPGETGLFAASPFAGEWTVAMDDDYTVWHLDVNSGCSFSDHFYSLEIPEDPNNMSDIQYTMTNWDVDYASTGCEGNPEVDLMYFNNNQLGVLTGANDSWSINSWPLDPGQVISGTNDIYIDTDSTNTGCWCVGVGFLEVRAKVGFVVKSHTPQADDKNRDFHAGKLDLTVTFSTEYDPASLTASTFKLEYRDQGGAWQQVGGNFAQLAPNKFRFTPSADLKDGVRYRATVKGGASGVKSKGGSELPGDTEWHFWTVPNLDLTDNFDYGSGSTCPPATAPCRGLELAVFQVARNAQMVTGGKPAVGRLYLRWKQHTDVHADDQLKEMEVNASIQVDGATHNQRQTVKRPDRYTNAEKVAAGNTINLYHTPNNAFNYTAEVTPHPQTNAIPVKYTHTLNLNSTGRSPNMRFDYYFLKDGTWSAGVPAAVKTAGRNIMNQGVRFITDQFPVLATSYDEMGDYSIGYTFTGNNVNDASCGMVAEVACPFWYLFSSNKAEWRCVYEKLQTMRGGHKFVAATVPSTLCPGATAFAIGGQVFMHQDGTGANDGTIAHEVGHIYGISTANNPTNAHRNNSTGVEGFQVRTRTNRSRTENPNASISLMHTTLQPSGTQWVHNDDYATLIGTVTAASQALFDAAEAEAGATAGPYLIVSGYIDLDTNQVDLAPAFLQEVPNDPPGTGTCTIALLDASDNTLSSDQVEPGLEVHVDMQNGEHFDTLAPEQTGPQFFTVSLPWNAAGAKIRVSCGGTTLLTQPRSPNNPTVDFVGLANGATLSGTAAVSWAGNDLDGPDLAYQLQLSLDGGATWEPLMPLSLDTSFNLDTVLLPSGAGAQLRVMVTDGFNTGYATRTVTIDNPLTVKGVLPASGATDAGLNGPVEMLFTTEIVTATLPAAFNLLEWGFTPVAGSLSYDPQAGALSFLPDEPLLPSTSYTAQLDGTVSDVHGNPLGATYSWSFTTAPDTAAPYVAGTHPQDAELNVPLNALVQVQFNEPMNSTTLTAASFEVRDAANNPVAGTVSYDAINNRAIFVPDANFAPNQVYTGRVAATAADAANNTLEGDYTWSFTTGASATPGTQRIVGNYSDEAVDLDGDGLYDQLLIYADVEVLADSSYNLNARLIDSAGRLLEWQTTGSTFLTKGVHRLQLAFSGVPIRSNGVDGPYTLDAVNFYDAFTLATFDVRYNAYQTFPYAAADFYSLLTLGGLPDQLLEMNTVREDAFNLRDYTTHGSLDVTSVQYTVFVNSNPAVGVSIDANANVDIYPAADTEAESDVTIRAEDGLGNWVLATFHVSVQQARASSLVSDYQPVMSVTLQQVITVEIRDQWDRLYTQPVFGTIEATAGTVNPSLITTDKGTVTFTYRAGSTPGPAFITITVDEVVTVLEIEVTGSGFSLFLPYIDK